MNVVDFQLGYPCIESGKTLSVCPLEETAYCDGAVPTCASRVQIAVPESAEKGFETVVTARPELPCLALPNHPMSSIVGDEVVSQPQDPMKTFDVRDYGRRGEAK